MTAIFIYFITASGLLLGQQAFLWNHLEQLHLLGLRLPIFIIINNFIILFCLFECIKKLEKKKLKLTPSKKKQWSTIIFSVGIISLAFTFSDAIYYARPFFTVIYTASGNKWQSLLLTAIAIAVSGFLIALLRFPVLILGTITRPNRRWVRVVHTLLFLPLMHLSEMGLLVIAPTLYQVALPLPVVFKKNLAQDAYKAVGLASEERVVYLFNPNITYRIQQQVFFVSGNEGFDSAGKLLGSEIRSSLGKHGSKSIAVILPEVIIKADSETQVEIFAQSLMAEIKKQPGVAVELLFGAQLKNQNFMLYQQWQNGKNSFGIVRKKSILYPFFERRTFGIDLGDPEASKDRQIALPTIAPTNLPPYARPESFDICYESLNLVRWHFGLPKIIVTNHSAFYDILFFSKSYDLTLQTLSTVFQSPLVLVGNRGLTGVYVDEQDITKLNQFFNSSKGQKVRFLRVVGF
jgi:hypothetical protein